MSSATRKYYQHVARAPALTGRDGHAMPKRATPRTPGQRLKGHKMPGLSYPGRAAGRYAALIRHAVSIHHGCRRYYDIYRADFTYASSRDERHTPTHAA